MAQRGFGASVQKQPLDTQALRKRTDHETFSSMGADEGSWTELHPSHPANPGWDGRDITPVVLSSFPATGPSHCAAPAYSLHPVDRRQERNHLYGNLVLC
jgi:hypothetical protein